MESFICTKGHLGRTTDPYCNLRGLFHVLRSPSLLELKQSLGTRYTEHSLNRTYGETSHIVTVGNSGYHDMSCVRR